MHKITTALLWKSVIIQLGICAFLFLGFHPEWDRSFVTPTLTKHWVSFLMILCISGVDMQLGYWIKETFK